MSFGFSPSDIFTLIQLTSQVYSGWKSACGTYTSITHDLNLLQSLLSRIEDEVSLPKSVFKSRLSDVKDIKNLCARCEEVVLELEGILNKYKKLSKSRQRNWERIRFGTKDLSKLNQRLVSRTTSLSAFVSTLVMSSQGRVEHELLPELLQKMDDVAAQMRAGNQSVTSAWTDYPGDDKQVWREFRRGLVSSGFRSSEIHKYSAALKLYLLQMQQNGMLDEEPAEEEPTKEVEGTKVDSIGNLAWAYGNKGQWDESEELGVQAMEARKRVLGPEHLDTLTIMANLALTYNDKGRYDEAEELQVQVIETCKRVLGPEHPDTLTSVANLATTFSKQGRWNEAEELDVQVVETRMRVLGPEHLDTLISVGNLASTYRDKGRWDEAEELSVQVMETFKKVLGPKHLVTLTSMNHLASTYINKGLWDKAEELLVQVIETCKRVLGPEHPETLISVANLASTFFNQGLWDKAEELQVQVTEIWKRLLGPNHPHTLSSMNNLACTWKSKGRNEEAIQLMAECVTLRKLALGADHPDTESSATTLSRW